MSVSIRVYKVIDENTSVTMYKKLKIVQRYYYFKSLYVEDITQTDINIFRQWTLDKNNKNRNSLVRATVQYVYTFISMFFNFAYNDVIININNMYNNIAIFYGM